MLESVELLKPVIALIAWSMVMWFWMYVTRLPAMRAAKIDLIPGEIYEEKMAALPASVRWKADNYNHLMEQPTLFYALVISLCILGADSQLVIIAAWAYTLLRIAHSFVQSIFNKIEIRFLLFVLSNVALLVLLGNAVSLLF
ncbi:MAPEG family protein [Thalassolituus oleivorans]|uniref:MAPEG family protein n=1 Tax=Thalassolituus oleivorans TaxID=187493 RepID=UPI001CE260E6|nr:MAPEG family protein [Thalassolituus oleivorans]MCA6129103.1 membrane protein [Thalassolituus oleivorans 4BN06-13]